MLAYCVAPVVSCVVCLAVSLFVPRVPEYPGIQWITTSMPWARRAVVCSLIALATCCPRPGSRYAVCLMAACELLKTATVVTPCTRSAFALVAYFCSATPIAQSSASNTSLVSWCTARGGALHNTFQSSDGWR